MVYQKGSSQKILGTTCSLCLNIFEEFFSLPLLLLPKWCFNQASKWTLSVIWGTWSIPAQSVVWLLMSLEFTLSHSSKHVCSLIPKYEHRVVILLNKVLFYEDLEMPCKVTPSLPRVVSKLKFEFLTKIIWL